MDEARSSSTDVRRERQCAFPRHVAPRDASGTTRLIVVVAVEFERVGCRPLGTDSETRAGTDASATNGSGSPKTSRERSSIA